jgi:hypothetical protein
MDKQASEYTTISHYYLNSYNDEDIFYNYSQ